LCGVSRRSVARAWTISRASELSRIAIVTCARSASGRAR
jgi:hypothetical protein